MVENLPSLIGLLLAMCFLGAFAAELRERKYKPRNITFIMMILFVLWAAYAAAMLYVS